MAIILALLIPDNEQQTVNKGTIGAVALLAAHTVAYALNPSLDVSQYAHTAWKVRDGFVRGAGDAIAQTPDGYLWLGTELGLFRFDGVRAVPWHGPAGEQLPSNYIGILLVTRDGTLWIGTLKGAASWKDGKLTRYPELAGLFVSALLEDREGTIWIGTFGLGLPSGKLCSIRRGEISCNETRTFGRGVWALHEDRKGNLWVAAPTGLWRWAPGPPEHYALSGGTVLSDGLTEGDGGALLIATSDGPRHFARGKIQTYTIPGLAGQFRPNYFFRSSDGSRWIGTAQGLLHLHQGRIDRFTAAEGLSGDNVHRIFEDHEGNVWVSTTDGLDRFREFVVPTVSVKQALSSSAAWLVQAAPDGSIWIGTLDGLSRWQNGAVTRVANRGLKGALYSLGNDGRGEVWASTREGVFRFERGRFVPVPDLPRERMYSIAGDSYGAVWLSCEQGLFKWIGERIVRQIPQAQLGQRHLARALLPVRDGLWLGFYEGGIAYVKDGKIDLSYTADDGLSHGIVNHLRLGSGGAIWVATEGGLSRVKDGRITTLTSKSGLPCDTVHWSIEDVSHAVWLYMPCGLVRIARSEWEAWVRGSKRAVQSTVFDSTDGVRSVAIYGSDGPHVTKSPDGKIWFVPWDGVSVIDPQHLPVNKLPPPVHIEQITADRKTFDATTGQRIPPLTRDLEIDYTALSFAAPEKNRFKYKLEGYDPDWHEVGNRRQAFYTNLPPRDYTFRVKASNNSGVWNEAGASLNFSVDPAYYQTVWFRALCAAGFVGLLYALYRYRVRQIAREFNVRLEERVGERTRIARDLHDTLLQSFQGLLLEFQAARNLFSRRPDEAMHSLDDAIRSAEAAITEGRNAIQDLRSGSEVRSDLAQLLTSAGQELSEAQAVNGNGTAFHLTVEGPPRALRSVLQDEIYRIGRELLRNAFLHARARRIELEIRYDRQKLRLRIRDDGIGIDPKVLAEGARVGHWGLPGVRERAKLIGAQLDFWSEAGAGTEVQVAVPASVAYLKSLDGRGFGLFRRMTRSHGE